MRTRSKTARAKAAADEIHSMQAITPTRNRKRVVDINWEDMVATANAQHPTESAPPPSYHDSPTTNIPPPTPSVITTPISPPTPLPTEQRSPGGTLWAMPAPVPSYFDSPTMNISTKTPETTAPIVPTTPSASISPPTLPLPTEQRSPGGTLWAMPAPVPSYLDLTPTPDTPTTTTPTPTPAQPPLLPRPHGTNGTNGLKRLPIWRRYGRWRTNKTKPEPPHRLIPSPMTPNTISPSPSPLNLPLLPSPPFPLNLNLNLSPIPLIPNQLNDTLLL